MTSNAIERAFARANVYRFLSLAFAYPMADIHRELTGGLAPACAAAEVLSDGLGAQVAAAAARLASEERSVMAADYRKTFTLSASPDCPMNEAAYSAKHVYQEVGELADISGFYQAFGLEIAGERPDELAAELEFCALLALKEGVAREAGDREGARVCRDASRLFLHDHLGRWGENVGRRIEVLAPDTAYAGFGRILAALVSFDIDLLKAGPISPYQEIPNPPEPIDDDGCPAEEGLGTFAYKLQGDGFIGELAEVSSPAAKGGS